MTGLIYKDFCVMKKQFRYYLVFLVIYTGMAVSGVFDASILSALVVVVALMVPISSMAYDDSAHWNRYAVAAPVGRRGVISAKYLFTLLVLVGCTLLVAVLAAVLCLTGLLNVPLTELLPAILACTGVALFMDAVLLPLLFRFGAEKSRIISMSCFVVIFGGALLTGKLLKSHPIATPPAWLAAALPVLLAALAVGSFIVSYCIARRIYNHREL